MSHTDGKWYIQDTTWGGMQVAAPSRNIADIHEHDIDNARLIAAAPTLLDLCEQVLDYLRTAEDPQGLIPELRDAITKATGEG